MAEGPLRVTANLMTWVEASDDAEDASRRKTKEQTNDLKAMKTFGSV